LRTGAGLRPKKCGAGAVWVGLRGGCGLQVCGCWAGAGKISQIPAGADKKFQPAQESSDSTVWSF